MKKITVPAAGKLEEISMDALGIYVMPGAPTYKDIEDYPSISFDSPGGYTYPLGPGATWGYQKCGFSDIFIKGTAASAGSELYILPLPTCPVPGMSADPGIVDKFEAGVSFKKAMDNSVQSYTDLELKDADQQFPVEIMISAHGGDINYLSKTDPAVGGSDHVLKDQAEPVKIVGLTLIKGLRFINAVADSGAVLITTPIY